MIKKNLLKTKISTNPPKIKIPKIVSKKYYDINKKITNGKN